MHKALGKSLTLNKTDLMAHASTHKEVADEEFKVILGYSVGVRLA